MAQSPTRSAQRKTAGSLVTMAMQSDDGAVLREVNINAIRTCLDRFKMEVEFYGLPLAANLIGAASRALTDEIAERDLRNVDLTHHKDWPFDP